jgi:ketosteroid isomerase-like protein
MNKLLLTCFFVLSAAACLAQGESERAIRKVMADQADAWSRGSIEGFMKGYWNNDSLVFVNPGGLTYGYTKTLENYKKRYNTPDKMGKLFFTLLSVKQLAPDYCFVLGKWLLKRPIGDIGGTYSLLFRKVDGRWVIVVDHTS